MKRARKIYLDYAASTPVDPAVFRGMSPYFTEKFGNPGSLHGFGQEAIAAVDSSRETIAKAIGANFREVIFTGSATEANNLALRGVVSGIGHQGSDAKKPRIIISAIEHESILETARDLERDGVDVVRLPVDRHGIVDLEKMKESLNEDTVLVSIMHANNEIGTIQPISEVVKIIGDFRNRKFQTSSAKSPKNPNHRMIQLPRYPLVHTDAAQSFQFLDCGVRNLGIDLMTLSAHKIYGPKGAGILYVKNPVVGSQYSGEVKRKKLLTADYRLLDAQLTGGGQEFGFRSGTENVPAIVGFAKAVELRDQLLIQANEQIRNLRDRLWKGIKKIFPKAEINGGSLIADRFTLHALPNILNVYFPGYDAQDLLTRFDLHGLAVSSGSACRSRAMESSYVIQALGYSKDRAKSSIRFSLGRPTTKEEIDEVLKIIKKVASPHSILP